MTLNYNTCIYKYNLNFLSEINKLHIYIFLNNRLLRPKNKKSCIHFSQEYSTYIGTSPAKCQTTNSDLYNAPRAICRLIISTLNPHFNLLFGVCGLTASMIIFLKSLAMAIAWCISQPHSCLQNRTFPKTILLIFY